MKFILVCSTILAVAYCDVAELQISNLPALVANIELNTTPELTVDETTLPALIPAASVLSISRAANEDLNNEYLPPDNEYLPPQEVEETYVPPQARNLINEPVEETPEGRNLIDQPVEQEVVAAVETLAPIELTAENTNSIQEKVLKPIVTKKIPGSFGKDEIQFNYNPNVPERIEIVPSSGYFYPQPKVLFLLRK